MCDEYMSSQEIRQKIADLKIRLAFQLNFEEEVDNLLADPNEVDTEQIKYMRDMEGKILQDIERRMGYKKSKCKQRHPWPRSMRIIAAIVILLLVGFGSALATVQMIRFGVLKLDIQTYSDHTAYKLVTTGNTLDIPQDWHGDFYPGYIPDGFEFSRCYTGLVEYRDSKDNLLSFSEDTYGATNALDTENAKCSTVSVMGTDATLIKKNGRCAVVWAINNRLFIVDMDVSSEEADIARDEVLKVAESVTLIK